MIERTGSVTIAGEHPQDIIVRDFVFSGPFAGNRASVEALLWAADVIQRVLSDLYAQNAQQERGSA